MTESLFEQYKAALRRGHLAALDGRLEDALAAYLQAGRLVPERALPLASQGTVLHRLERWEEAVAAFQAALRLAPDDEATLRARGPAQAARGLTAAAAKDFERLAFVLDVAGRQREAADAARRAAELEPSPARAALVERLAGAAEDLADDVPVRGRPGGAAGPMADVPAADPESLAAAVEAEATALAREAAGALGAEVQNGSDERPVDGEDEGLAALRASLAYEPDAVGTLEGDQVPGEDDLGGENAVARESASIVGAGDPKAGHVADAGAGVDEDGEERHDWPPVDLPSMPPPPVEGPPPDPEELLAVAVSAIEAQDLIGARDMMLTAAAVHRDAGRLDASLEICLQLLGIAPGDPQVHLAIANLQLDRGWTDLAKEKIDLLVRLTSLTGDTQAEADVHFLASERLRDDPVASPGAR